jgi:hypothetical protein
MNMHKNGRLTPFGRERISRQVDRSEMGLSISPGRIGGLAVPVIAATSAASADASGGRRGDRAVTPPTLDGKADRGASRCLASHFQPRLARVARTSSPSLKNGQAVLFSG